ncbi:hypothetical protein ACWEKM_00305 [Streptomyces sp. NPDC004752]
MEKRCRCGRYGVWNGISWDDHDCDYKESGPERREKQRRRSKPSDEMGSSADASTRQQSGCLGCLGLLVIIAIIWGTDGFAYLLKVVIAVVTVTFQALSSWIEGL